MNRFTQNKFLVMLVAILLVANLGVMFYFFVFRPRERHTGRPGSMSDFMQNKLGLTPEQTARYRALRDEHKESVRPVVDDMRKLKDSLFFILRDPNPNDAAAVDLSNRIGEKQKQWEIMIFRHFQKLRAICDNNQLPKFDSMVRHMINGPWMRKKRPADK